MKNIKFYSFLPILFSSGGFVDFYFLIPICILVLFPPVWIITFPVCWLINYCFIKKAAEKCYIMFQNKERYNNLVIKSTILCFIFDLLLSLFIIFTFYCLGEMEYIVGDNFKYFYENMLNSIMNNPLSNIGTFLIMCLDVLIVKSIQFLIYSKYIIKKLDIDEDKKKKFALYTIIFTIPYHYFLPSEWLTFK